MEPTHSGVDGTHALSTRDAANEELLWKSKDADPAARERLILRYQQYARKLALRYHRGPESPDDLIQVAMVGLVSAVDRFDYTSGSQFLSFASPTITGEIKRYFRDRVWMVRVPRNVQEDIYAVDQAIAELSAELHRTPTMAEIESRANVEDGGVSRALEGRTNRQVKSLDGGDDPDQPDQSLNIGEEDRKFTEFDEGDDLWRAIEGLGQTEQLVLRLRFVEDLTQSEIAERIGCSQMHISRLLKRSLASVQKEIDE